MLPELQVGDPAFLWRKHHPGDRTLAVSKRTTPADTLTGTFKLYGAAAETPAELLQDGMTIMAEDFGVIGAPYRGSPRREI